MRRDGDVVGLDHGQRPKQRLDRLALVIACCGTTIAVGTFALAGAAWNRAGAKGGPQSQFAAPPATFASSPLTFASTSPTFAAPPTSVTAPPTTAAPVATTTTTVTGPPPSLPANGQGLSLSGYSGWLWNGPPLLLTSSQGIVITLQNQYSSWNTERSIAADVQAPALPTSESEFDMNLTFAAPSGKELHVGLYQDATRAPFADVGPGIDISGMGDGCNTEQGRFDVKSLSWGTAGAKSFDITFLDYCDGSGPLRGELRYGS